MHIQWERLIRLTKRLLIVKILSVRILILYKRFWKTIRIRTIHFCHKIRHFLISLLFLVTILVWFRNQIIHLILLFMLIGDFLFIVLWFLQSNLRLSGFWIIVCLNYRIFKIKQWVPYSSFCFFTLWNKHHLLLLHLLLN